MASVAQKTITAEEFALLPEPADGSRLELVRGEVVVMPPPGFRHGLRQVRISSMLDHYVHPRKLGRVTVESGVVTERDPDTVRGPDVAYWSADRVPLDQEPEGYPAVAPNLCVEILSPHKVLSKLRKKMREYFAQGVIIVWIVDPEERTVTVYRSAEQGQVLHDDATLSGEEVIPGFACKVAELFA